MIVDREREGFMEFFKFFLSLVEGFLEEGGEGERKKHEVVLGPRSSKSCDEWWWM